VIPFATILPGIPNTLIMKYPVLFIALAFVATGFSSCASDHDENLTYRLKKRNDDYLDKQERRSMRKEARDKRYNAWFDRIMD
jgi:hypothetical protein